MTLRSLRSTPLIRFIQGQLWRLEDELQAARKSVDDAQEKLAAAAADRAAAAVAKDKELWARDAEVRRLQSKVEAAEAAAAARRVEAERMKELAELREQEAQAAERSRAESSSAFDAMTQAALQKQQLAHSEELRSVARERSKDAGRLSEAEATIQSLRSEIAAAAQRVAAAESAAQEARAGAEVLLQQVQSVQDRAEGSGFRHRPHTADSDVQRPELRSVSSSHAPLARQQLNRSAAAEHPQEQQQHRASTRTPLLVDVSQELLSPPTLPEYVATPPLPPYPHAVRSGGGGGGRPRSAIEDAGGLIDENKRLRAAVQDMRLQVTCDVSDVWHVVFGTRS